MFNLDSFGLEHVFGRKMRSFWTLACKLLEEFRRGVFFFGGGGGGGAGGCKCHLFFFNNKLRSAIVHSFCIYVYDSMA